MRKLPSILMLIIAVAGSLPFALDARAEGAGERRRDHDLARRGLEEGAILPLDKVLAAVRAQFAGEIAKIELEHERDRWLYEIKMIAPNGVMLEIHVDARTGTILNEKSK